MVRLLRNHRLLHPKESRMRTRLLAAVTTAVLGVLAFTGGTAQANHSWGGYHWARTANPFTLKVMDNVSGVWDTHLNTAIADWSQSSVLDLTKVAGSGSAKSCRPVSGRIKACNASYGNTGWLGIAQIWITGGTHITQGTTKVNDYYFNQAQYNTTAWRNLVMCQEIAHDFGLDHQNEDFDNPNLGTCMDYTNDPSTNQHPNQHDYDQLVTIYSHLDSFSTVDTSAAVPGTAGNSPASWGRQVSGSASHGTGLYVRDLGRGNLVVTHVIWA
jgi:hypothetical protein